MVLTGYLVLSPVTGFFATVVSVMRSIIAHLTPASGRQDHTSLPSASLRPSSKAPLRVHHIPPRVRDDRDTPLPMGRNGYYYNPKSRGRQALFCKPEQIDGNSLAARGLFDHFVGAREQCRWQVETKCLSGLEVKNQIVF